MAHDINRLVLIGKSEASLVLCLKNKNLDTSKEPKMLIRFDVNGITVNLNNYLYTVLNYIVDIMR